MNDLDDELLKELGLEPKKKESVEELPAEPSPAAPKPAPKNTKEPMPPAAPSVQSEVASPPKSSGAIQDGLSTVTQVQIAAVIGKKTTNLKELMALKEGSSLELNKLPGETIDLVANGKLVAKGQLILIDGRIGVQIKQIYS
jgi:flagellar motor switch protein FliN/FliY